MEPKIALVMGSKSDLPKLEAGIDLLREFGVPYEVRVMSAHRTPVAVAEYARTAAAAGLKVIIAAAGLAAHLAGAIAANTLLPVIGIPVKGGAMDGLDALLSTVQMPGGIPVATVGLGSHGAKNAAFLAIQILALEDEALVERLKAHRAGQADVLKQADADIRKLSSQ